MSRVSYCVGCVIRKVARAVSCIGMMSGVLCALAFLLCYEKTLPSVYEVWSTGTILFIVVAFVFKLIEVAFDVFLNLFGEAYRFYYNELLPCLSSQQVLSLERFARTLKRKDKIHFFHTLYLMGKPLEEALTFFPSVWYEKDGVVVFDNHYRYQIITNRQGVVTGLKMLPSVAQIDNYDNVVTRLEQYTV